MSPRAVPVRIRTASHFSLENSHPRPYIEEGCSVRRGRSWGVNIPVFTASTSYFLSQAVFFYENMQKELWKYRLSISFLIQAVFTMPGKRQFLKIYRCDRAVCTSGGKTQNVKAQKQIYTQRNTAREAYKATWAVFH